jgi:hypothetical protein
MAAYSIVTVQAERTDLGWLDRYGTRRWHESSAPQEPTYAVRLLSGHLRDVGGDRLSTFAEYFVLLVARKVQVL